MIDFRPDYSRKVLVRLAIFIVLAAILVAASVEFITDVYFRNQLTPTGIIINGSILALFLVGIGRMAMLLIRYAREEKAVHRFMQAVQDEELHPATEIDPNTVIFQRYQALLTLSKQHAPIDHSALAAMLLARESTRVSLPKFINNVLILTGVFGTIVSLSIALVGASNLLGTAGEVGNMGLVIHGMSTALSTTITAIICFLFHGYFFLKLTDAQTYVVTAVEQVTSLYLLPRFSRTGDGLVAHVANLVERLEEVMDEMRRVQAEYRDAGLGLREAADALAGRVVPVADDVRSIRGLLRQGFRLPPEGDE